jgi:hypothetical protein
MTHFRLPKLSILASAVLIGCGGDRGRENIAQSVGQPAEELTQSELPEIEAVPDSAWPDYPDEARLQFNQRFRTLSAVSAADSGVRVVAGSVTIVDSLRSQYPRSHVLFADGDVVEDRVLFRALPTNRVHDAFVLVQTDGPSGDPGFYSIRLRDGARGEVVAGEAIAWPTADSAIVAQRANSLYGRLVTAVVRDGVLTRIAVEHEALNIATVALTEVLLSRSPETPGDDLVIARGDSVTIVAARHFGRGGPAFEVHTRSGARGWVRVSAAQCPAAVFRGICWYGD